jgi:hypothetical protein
MRYLSLLLFAACTVGGPQPDPPLLTVTSPQRSLVQDTAGALVVTGRVEANPTGSAVKSVVVNGTQATIASDGSFTVTIEVPPGATLIHTVASDVAGGLATDTRSVIAGERRMSGSNVESAIGAALSPKAFTKISEIGTDLIKKADLMALVQSLNPVVHAGDDNGPDCLYAQAFVDTITITDAAIALDPVDGGLHLNARIDKPHITGHEMHAVACLNGMGTFDIQADSVTIDAVLQLNPNGMNGFTAELANPKLLLPGLKIQSSNIPQDILNLLPLQKIIEFIAPTAIKLFVNPMLNDAFGALTQPQTIAALGKNLTLQVAPRTVNFTPAGGKVMLDMRMAMEGAAGASGFTFTPNGTPAMDPGDGLGLGIADDLANDALAQLTASGLLNLALKQPGSEFNTAVISATNPPMISADGANGDRLRLIMPDLMVTFLDQGQPVAQAAVNAQLDVAIRSADNGASVAIDLGTPAIAIDNINDSTGLTMPPGSEFARVIELGAGDQKGTITEMLGHIPLPKVAGIALTDVSVTGGAGYVMVKTNIK